MTRRAEPDDMVAIVGLWKRFMEEEKEAIPDPQVDGVESRWKERLRQQIAGKRVIVAETGRSVCGFLGFIDSTDRVCIPQGVAYVVDLYVAPEARRGSAAKDLFSTLLEAAGGAYSEVWTNTNVRNVRMQKLLKRAGFAPMTGFAIGGLKDNLYYRLFLKGAQ
jgi:ribosomal protein S18 acetylase RimI-like enzyme